MEKLPEEVGRDLRGVGRGRTLKSLTVSDSLLNLATIGIVRLLAVSLMTSGTLAASVGCAVHAQDDFTQQMDADLASWVGKPIAGAFQQYGRPQTVLNDGQGGKIYVWPLLPNAEQVSRGDLRAGYRKLWADSEGIVYRWEWRVQ